MASYTTNYKLKKPLGTENYNIEDQNGNMDIIDIKIKEIDNKTSSITVPVTKVNNKIGDVILKAEDIETNAGSTLEAAIKTGLDKIGVLNQTVELHKAESASFAEYRISNTQTLANNAQTTIVFDNVISSKDFSQIGTGANQGKIQILKAGTYLITCGIAYAVNNVNERNVRLHKNGNLQRSNIVQGVSNNLTMAFLTIIVNCTENDILEVLGSQSSGNALDVVTGMNTHMAIHKLN